MCFKPATCVLNILHLYWLFLSRVPSPFLGYYASPQWLDDDQLRHFTTKTSHVLLWFCSQIPPFLLKQTSAQFFFVYFCPPMMVRPSKWGPLEGGHWAGSTLLCHSHVKNGHQLQYLKQDKMLTYVNIIDKITLNKNNKHPERVRIWGILAPHPKITFMSRDIGH